MAQTILIVEDESVVLNFARTVLKNRGYHVLAANSVAEGRAMMAGLKDTAGLCLVIDVVLGDESGIAFAHEVMEKEPRHRVLLISGFTDDVLIGHPDHSQRMAFLRKPFTRDELIKAVESVAVSAA